MCVCVRHVHANILCTEKKKVPDSLGLELQAVSSHLMWVLRTEWGSSARAVLALNCQVTFPALLPVFYAVFWFWFAVCFQRLTLQFLSYFLGRH